MLNKAVLLVTMLSFMFTCNEMAVDVQQMYEPDPSVIIGGVTMGEECGLTAFPRDIIYHGFNAQAVYTASDSNHVDKIKVLIRAADYTEAQLDELPTLIAQAHNINWKRLPGSGYYLLSIYGINSIGYTQTKNEILIEYVTRYYQIRLKNGK